MRWIACLLGALAAVTLASPSPAEAWTRYTNDRFGTSAEIPLDRFTPEPAPANNDGRTFISKSGSARILVYGSHAPSVVVNSFEAYKDWLTAEEDQGGLRVTHQVAGKDWFAISGAKGPAIVYIKVLAGCPDRSVAHHVRIDYPITDKARYDPIVARVSRSLRGSSVGCR
jgi:hypothetical protein